MAAPIASETRSCSALEAWSKGISPSVTPDSSNERPGTGNAASWSAFAFSASIASSSAVRLAACSRLPVSSASCSERARLARTFPLIPSAEAMRSRMGSCRPDVEPYSPLALVLRGRRCDLLDLLLDAGADPKTVDPDAVFDTYSREIMERFWALGVDLAGDGALAAALAHATRNRPLYGFVKNHRDDPRIQQELDVALGWSRS